MLGHNILVVVMLLGHSILVVRNDVETQYRYFWLGMMLGHNIFLKRMMMGHNVLVIVMLLGHNIFLVVKDEQCCH